MATNKGMTNSARFYNNSCFDIEKCFNTEATQIKSALSDITYILNNPDKFSEEDVQFHANNLADEFYTILKVALSWENKKLKNEKG